MLLDQGRAAAPTAPEPCTQGMLCSLAPTRGAGSSSRTWNTPPIVSILSPTHHRATKALASVVSAKVDRDGVIQNPAHPRRCHRPAIGAAVLIQPGRDLRMPLPKTFRWYGDPDAHGKSSFGCDDHFARVAWHQMFLVRSRSENAAEPGCRPAPWGFKMAELSFLLCVAASASPPM